MYMKCLDEALAAQRNKDNAEEAMKPFHLEVSRSLLSHFGKRQAFLVLLPSHLFIWLTEGTEIEKTGGCLVNDRLGCSGMEN